MSAWELPAMNELDLFIAGLQVDDPVERAAYLDEACGGDGDMRKRVSALMAAIDQPDALLERFLAVRLEAAPMEAQPDTSPEGSSMAASDCQQTVSHQEKTGAPAPLIGSIISGRYKSAPGARRRGHGLGLSRRAD